MIFKAVTAKNFLSIDKMSIQLDNRGLVLIVGENHDNPALSSNGAGKSSIIESIVYTLYGRTLRGLRADDVVSKNTGKDCYTGLLIEDNGHNYMFIRYRKHNKYKNSVFIYRDKVDITPRSDAEYVKFVTDFLAADYTTFTSSLLYSAESFKFTSATDAEMKSTFDTMLGLDVYTKAHDKVNSDLTNLNIRISTNRKKYDELLAVMNATKSRLDSLKKKSADYKDEKLKKKTDLLTKIANAERDIREKRVFIVRRQTVAQSAQSQISKLSEELDKAKESSAGIDKLKLNDDEICVQISTISARVKEMVASIPTKVKEQEKFSSYLSRDRDKLSDLKKKLEDIDKKIGTPCPVCGRPLEEKHLESAKSEIRKEISAVESDYKSNQSLLEQVNNSIDYTRKKIDKETLLKSDYTKKHMELKAKIDSIRHSVSTKDVDSLQSKIDDEKKKLEDANTAIKVADNDIKHLNDSCLTCQKSLDELDKEENPYEVMIASVSRDISGGEKHLSDLKKEGAELSSKKGVLSFWLKAYSNQGIKSYILDSVTPYLNQRVNFYLDKLAGGNIEVIFSTQTTLKSGDKREKFSITINNKDGGTTYSSNSGGERKRIDLAINLALQDLVSSRGNKPISLAVYDEVFDALDDLGIESVVSILNELVSKKSSIFVISHNDQLQSYFTNTMKVVKEEGKSHVI